MEAVNNVPGNVITARVLFALLCFVHRMEDLGKKKEVETV